MTLTDQRIGAQRPRLFSLPADISSTDTADELIEFAERFGLILDDWQRWCVRNIAAERADGSWSATQSVLLVPRQAGKSALLEAIELAALFLWDYEHVIYSAHLQKTSTDHMRRIRRHIDRNPDLKRIGHVKTGKGDEMVERRDTGAILEFITRGKKTSRGGSPGLVVFDEALFLEDDQIQAMLPAMSAQSMNEDTAAQMIYTSSAPVAESTVLHRLRKRGINDKPPRMFFAEWSVPADADPSDRDNWYAANPGLGIRISEEWVADNEFGTLSHEAFMVERLGVPIDPIGDDAYRLVSADAWANCHDKDSTIASNGQWSFTVSPDRKWASFGIAGRTADGRIHVECIDRRAGTSWVLDRAVEAWSKRRIPVRIHKSGPEGSFIPLLLERGVGVVEVSSADVARATGQFIDDATAGTLAHLDDIRLNKAIENAVVRPNQDGANVWDQRRSSVEITPLMCVTVALTGVTDAPRSKVMRTRGARSSL